MARDQIDTGRLLDVELVLRAKRKDGRKHSETLVEMPDMPRWAYPPLKAMLLKVLGDLNDVDAENHPRPEEPERPTESRRGR